METSRSFINPERPITSLADTRRLKIDHAKVLAHVVRPAHVLDIVSSQGPEDAVLLPKFEFKGVLDGLYYLDVTGFGTALHAALKDQVVGYVVRLVDVRETPIERITPTGIRTSETEYAFDMIVYATGFDAITGAFDRIDIRGRSGQRLRDKWADGPRTFLGLQVAGFPNMLALVGPHNAATFCNIPRCIEQNVDWVTALLQHMLAKGYRRIEPTLTRRASESERTSRAREMRENG